jgi:hypothetical protein
MTTTKERTGQIGSLAAYVHGFPNDQRGRIEAILESELILAGQIQPPAEFQIRREIGAEFARDFVQYCDAAGNTSRRKFFEWEGLRRAISLALEESLPPAPDPGRVRI